MTTTRLPRAILPLAAVLALLSACSAPPMAAADKSAVARLLTADGQPGGQARLADTPQGLEVAITVHGMKPGLHGFHLHANGACQPGPDGATGRIVPFGAAGPHFDPGMSHNHGAPGTAPHQAHAGELPNITVGADGRGTLRYVNPHLSLASGSNNALGRSLVVHADPDDYQTDPSGNSGGRVLCGLIEPA